jgi:hypothetical protein
VHAVPARAGGLDQVSAAEQFQPTVDDVEVSAGECGNSVRVYVGAWM